MVAGTRDPGRGPGLRAPDALRAREHAGTEEGVPGSGGPVVARHRDGTARLEDAGLEGRDAVKRQLTELVERYQTLEKTPTWPVDRSIRRRFTLQNLGLLLPFAGYLVGPPEFWHQVSDLVSGLG